MRDRPTCGRAASSQVLTEREHQVAPRPASGTEAPAGSLNILHVLRAPVGRLFRHVLELVRGQHAQGRAVRASSTSSEGGKPKKSYDNRPVCQSPGRETTRQPGSHCPQPFFPADADPQPADASSAAATRSKINIVRIMLLSERTAKRTRPADTIRVDRFAPATQLIS